MKENIYNKMYVNNTNVHLFTYGDGEENCDWHFPRNEVIESIYDNLFGNNHVVLAATYSDTFASGAFLAYIADRTFHDEEFSSLVVSTSLNGASNTFGRIWNYVVTSSYTALQKMDAIERLKNTNQYSIGEDRSITVKELPFAKYNVVRLPSVTSELLSLLEAYFNGDYKDKYLMITCPPQEQEVYDLVYEKFGENVSIVTKQTSLI